MGLFSRSEYHTHNHNTEIKEYRAATDESIRLYDEMQQKARENVLSFGKAKLEGMTGEFEFYIARRVEKMFDIEIGIMLILNDNEVKKIINISRYDIPECASELIEIIYKNVSNMIASELVLNENTLSKLREVKL